MAKRTWLDGQVGNTPITAARLNDLETDVEAALAAVGTAGPTLVPDPENPGLYFVV